MSPRLRLLPVVIFSAALFLTVRVGGIYVEVGGTSVAETAVGKPIDLTAGMNAAPRSAGGGATKPAAEPAPAKNEPAKADAAAAGAGSAGPSVPRAAAQASATAPAPAVTPATTPGATADAKEDAEHERRPDATRAPAPTPAAAQPPAVVVEETPPRPVLPRKPPRDEALPDPVDMSRADLKILQELAQRRREMERREQELEMRAGLLKAAEKRVEEKIAELTAMKAQLEALVKQHEEQQNVQLNSLVKIYERMKPKDAAQIFDELDMTILVEILAHMKEARSAPILAAMTPKRVKEVTARLINRRTLGPRAESEDAKSAIR